MAYQVLEGAQGAEQVWRGGQEGVAGQGSQHFPLAPGTLLGVHRWITHTFRQWEEDWEWLPLELVFPASAGAGGLVTKQVGPSGEAEHPIRGKKDKLNSGKNRMNPANPPISRSRPEGSCQC